jgi:hypothetical protein
MAPLRPLGERRSKNLTALLASNVKPFPIGPGRFAVLGVPFDAFNGRMPLGGPLKAKITGRLE